MGDIAASWPDAPVDRDYTAAAVEGAQAGQEIGGINALRGINLNNQDSVNNGLANLVRYGATKQAEALIGLQINRDIYGGLPGFQAAVNNAGRTPPPAQAGAPPAAPDPTAALHAQVAQDARAYAAAPPDQQAAMKPQLEDKYTKLGIPKDTIDGALQQVSTPEGAAAFADNHDAHAAMHNGGPPNADAVQAGLPPGMAPPQPGDGVDPYKWAQAYYAHPEWGAYEAKVKSKLGLDLGYAAKAAAIMGPEFSQRAAVDNAAALAGETAKGGLPYKTDETITFNGKPIQVTGPQKLAILNNPDLRAAGFGVGLSPGEQAEQTAAGSAAGSSPANIQTANLGGGRTLQGTFAPSKDGSYVFKPLPISDSSGTHPAAPTSSPGEIEANTKSNEQYQGDRALVADSNKRLVVLRHVNDILNSPQGGTGPGTQAVNGFKSFLLAQAPQVLRQLDGHPGETEIKVASQDQLHKYMVQLAGNAAAQYGQGTNEKLALAASGNANPDISTLANKDVTRLNIAMERANQARLDAFQKTGKSGDAYSDFSANWGKSVDPRAFMVDLLSKDERIKLQDSLKTDAEKISFVKGVNAAIAAGMFKASDIKR